VRKQPVVLALIAITVGVSLIAAMSDPFANAVALVPHDVFRGEVWRLVTWAFLQWGPIGLLLVSITLYKFGGDLLDAWGRRRFTRFVAMIVLVSGVGSCLLALPIPNAEWYPLHGGYAIADALTIAWALQFPDRCVIVFRMMPVAGNQLAYGTLAVTLMFVLYWGLTPFAPDLVAGLAALAYMKRPWDRLTPTPVTPPSPWAN